MSFSEDVPQTSSSSGCKSYLKSVLCTKQGPLLSLQRLLQLAAAMKRDATTQDAS